MIEIRERKERDTKQERDGYIERKRDILITRKQRDREGKKFCGQQIMAQYYKTFRCLFRRPTILT
jgi:hypothetical protein